MKITLEFLQKKGACSEGVSWFKGQKASVLDAVVEGLIKEGSDEKLNWANWLVTRTMDKPQRVNYALFAAEQVVGIFEKKYPKDERPRKAIDAARKWLDSQTEENRKAADAAAYAADAAADAAAHAAADAAAHAAAYAAAGAAAGAADAAAHAADADAAYAAADADAKNQMKVKIIRYGLEILRKGS